MTHKYPGHVISAKLKKPLGLQYHNGLGRGSTVGQVLYGRDYEVQVWFGVQRGREPAAL